MKSTPPFAVSKRAVPFTALLLAGLLALSACGAEEGEQAQPTVVPIPAPPPEATGLILTPTDLADLPGLAEDRIAQALPALKKSCGRLQSLPDARAVGPEGQAGTVADWRQPCAALAALQPGDEAGLRQALEHWFAAFQASTPESETGLFTGYYESELRGFRQPPEEAPEQPPAVPLYRLPGDLVTVDLGSFRADLAGQRLYGRLKERRLVPYFTRAEIDAGAVDGRGLELIWAEDAVAAFFLHVQGSGRVILPDGQVVRVGFAGSNGHPFTGIGRVLIDEGAVSRKEASMQTIRDWLRANPERAAEVMRKNARYIFFREIEGEGPIGAQGVPLTAGRSLAVDPDFIALGLPMFLDTTWPASDRPLRRLMVAQDRGAAIKGAIRGDFYWGSGPEALKYAGRMKEKGRLYLFLPKTVAERRELGS